MGRLEDTHECEGLPEAHILEEPLDDCEHEQQLVPGTHEAQALQGPELVLVKRARAGCSPQRQILRVHGWGDTPGQRLRYHCATPILNY